MSDHGNSLQNPNPHHLYEIRDTVEDNVFKYGISDDQIGKDGLSKRLRSQVNILNLAVGFARYIGVILLRNIQGRAKAKAIEDEYIDRYFDEHGKRPRGNPVGGSRR